MSVLYNMTTSCPRVNDPESVNVEDWEGPVFYDLILKVIYHHLCSILLFTGTLKIHMYPELQNVNLLGNRFFADVIS